MADGMTLQGMYEFLDVYLRGATPPTNLYLALCTDANTPDKDTDLMSDLTQIATGNGYTDGGYQLSRNSTDWPSLTKGTTDVVAALKNIIWTATGGSIPASGDGARWAVLTDDNVTVANRKVLAWFDLTSARSITNGQQMSLAGGEAYLEVP